jgi:hypothetical protein
MCHPLPAAATARCSYSTVLVGWGRVSIAARADRMGGHTRRRGEGRFELAVRLKNAGAALMALTVGALGVGAAGCDRDASTPAIPFAGSATSSATVAPHTTSPTSASPQAFDYTRLLIEARDILAANDTYTAQPPMLNPSGTQGAEVLFTNHDQTRAVGDTIVILPNAGAAPSALQQATASLGTSVTGRDPQPSPVGAGGTVVSGMSRDQSKTVTILLFTEGRAFVRLEFDSAPGETTPADFVTDVGQKQDIALRTGLPG